MAGLTEADYVACGLADDVRLEIERILRAEDRAAKPSPKTFHRKRRG